MSLILKIEEIKPPFLPGGFTPEAAASNLRLFARFAIARARARYIRTIFPPRPLADAQRRDVIEKTIRGDSLNEALIEKIRLARGEAGEAKWKE